MSTASTPLRLIRTASALVAAVSIALLGLVAVESGSSVTRHTVVVRHDVRVQTPLAQAASPTPAASAVGSAAPSPSLVAPTPLVTSAPSVVASPSVVVTSAATTAPASTPAPATPTSTAPSGTTPPATAAVLPACPLPLPATTASGGLQSLIGFAPLFGPFSAEAFASAAAFQPVLELFGPFLVAFAKDYAPVQPQLAPLLAQVESFENEGYSLISPLYGPYRTKFLTAETALATALAPVASALVDNPASACVVDLEGVLTAAS